MLKSHFLLDPFFIFWEKPKRLILVIMLCFSKLFSFDIQVKDKNSEDREYVIAKILEIQKSLLLPLDISQPNTEGGFLTVETTSQYLIDFLQTGVFLIAVHEDQIVGYLLLDQIEQFISWSEGKRFESKWNLHSLVNRGYIDQIGIAKNHLRQGIGSALVEYAKKIFPKGLLTDILLTPYSNSASLQFFTAKGFGNIGTMYIEKTAARPEHSTSVMLWLPIRSGDSF